MKKTATMMIRYSDTGVPYYQFSHFSQIDFLRHGIFTRHGGVSPVPFDSLNIARSVGDKPDHVNRNRRIISDAMGVSEMTFIHQVHGTDVRVLAHEGFAGSGLQAGTTTGDAMVTDTPGKNLVIQVADCQAVMMVDPVLRVIANVHAGWRGVVLDIIGKTVAVMKDRFGCRPDRMLAGTGPSLGPCCAEFIHYRREIPKTFWRYMNHEVYVDLWAISRDQIISAGVPEDNIESSGICTRCRSDDFFSYRKHKTTGRFAAVIGIGDDGNG
ncbi:MAG: peptidoglycan editing factor PgeF [Desulfobacterales bacterium]